MAAWLISCAMAERPAQRLDIQDDLKMVLRASGCMSNRPPFCSTAASSLQARQPVRHQAGQFLGLDAAQHIAIGGGTGQTRVGQGQHRVEPVRPQAHPLGNPRQAGHREPACPGSADASINANG
jgi:hypothetical protein